jgi:ribosomal protein S18 acetylase RimI-like enzyme
MSFEIRKALPKDMSGVIGLLREFAEFEKLDHYLEITNEKLADVLFGDDAFVECLVAFDNSMLVAYAILYPNFATFRGQKGMYLEDIFIKSEYRGTGLGERLLKEIAKLARVRGCQRIDFVVLDWNTPAIRFYEKHGAVRDEQERRFKFVNDAFERLAS